MSSFLFFGNSIVLCVFFAFVLSFQCFLLCFYNWYQPLLIFEKNRDSVLFLRDYVNKNGFSKVLRSLNEKLKRVPIQNRMQFHESLKSFHPRNCVYPNSWRNTISPHVQLHLQIKLNLFAEFSSLEIVFQLGKAASRTTWTRHAIRQIPRIPRALFAVFKTHSLAMGR